MSEQRLIAGQNTELDSETLVFTVQPAHMEVAALVLDDQRRPLNLPGAGYSDASNPAGSPGINAETSRLTIRLGALPDTAARVLCIALTPHPDREALTCALAHDAGHATVFDVSAADAPPGGNLPRTLPPRPPLEGTGNRPGLRRGPRGNGTRARHPSAEPLPCSTGHSSPRVAADHPAR